MLFWKVINHILWIRMITMFDLFLNIIIGLFVLKSKDRFLNANNKLIGYGVILMTILYFAFGVFLPKNIDYLSYLFYTIVAIIFFAISLNSHGNIKKTPAFLLKIYSIFMILISLYVYFSELVFDPIVRYLGVY